MNRTDPAKRAMAIELFALGGYTVEKVAYEVGVHPSTLANWRKMADFNEAVIARARQNLRDRLPAVYAALAAEAEQGHHQHAKILLDHIDKLEEKARVQDEASITFTWRRTGDPSLLPAPPVALDGEGAVLDLPTGDVGAD